jgi:nucleoside triphosphate pyrophosphatase
MIEAVVLASASPVRARLLAAAGVEFCAVPAEIDEDAVKRVFRAENRSPEECALALAEDKARRVAKDRERDLVIGADQILVCGETWFDKPPDLAGARAQLQLLRGRSHELVTAACVVRREERLWWNINRPTLTMRDFSDGFLNEYLKHEGRTVLGSVGAYRLEGKGAQLFEQIVGDYFAVLGLPLLELLGFLRASGVLRS